MSAIPSPIQPKHGGYDPTAEQPYTPPQLPEVQIPDPNVTAPAPAQHQHGPMSTLGGFAQLGDSLFRGYMRGKAMGDVKKAIQLKKKSDDAQAAVKMTSDALQGAVNSGEFTGDQINQIRAGQRPQGMTDEQFQKAQQMVNAVNGAFSAQMEVYKPHVKKQGKGAQQKQGGIGALIQRLHSDKPDEVMSATYEAMEKLGPSVYYQLGDSKAQAQRRETAGLEQQNVHDAEKLQHEVYQLEAIPSGQRTPEQQQRLAELTQKPGAEKPGSDVLKAKDQIVQKIMKDPYYHPSEYEMRIMGWSSKPTIHYGKNGEIIAVSTGADGEPSYDVMRPGSPSQGPQAKPLPPATIATWEKEKNAAIKDAFTLYSASDAKNKISADEVLKRWQAAQDEFEHKYSNNGHPVPHVVIKDNVQADPSQPNFGQWHGRAMSQNASQNPQEIPSGVTSHGVVDPRGLESLGLPPELARNLEAGKITCFGNGQRWTLRHGKPQRLQDVSQRDQ